MPKFIIERDIPGVGKFTVDQIRGTSQTSNKVISDLGPEIQWQTSYVTDDRIYCVYIAASEDIIFEHARCVGIPADRISRVVSVIDPTTGD